MNFCEHCNFMLYKKLSGVDSCKESVPEDSSICDLIEYCKNCGFEKQITDDSISVYSRNYKSSFVIDNILKNKYIIYDNTLPRLSIDCKNTGCVTHKKFNYLNKTNSFIVNNIPENIDAVDIYDMLYQFPYQESFQEVLPEIKTYVKTFNNLRMHYKRIRLSEVVVYYTHAQDEALDTSENLELLETINSALKDYLENLSLEDKFLQKEKLYVEEYKSIENEVIYVKYDPENMKYLYICVNCGTSW